ncbi:hypothetical protein V6N12_045599 [Hibiscus sabdariffa]|uniref:Uncharacterized protein n=1 Tax=Hibiscus sabdariffa TaxID=183260 RepID=A0ABR2G380_9ROSI
MDTASMLDEVIRYVKFLKRRILVLQRSDNQQPPDKHVGTTHPGHGFRVADNRGNPSCFNHETIESSRRGEMNGEDVMLSQLGFGMMVDSSGDQEVVNQGREA